MSLKSYIPQDLKDLIKKLPFNFTKNQRYDYYTAKIINARLKDGDNCIDIGCFKGEVLDLFLAASPNGQHFAFEPVPRAYKTLVNKYKDYHNVKIFERAVSNEVGSVEFNYVTSNPAYSGIKKRDYDDPNEKDEKILVKTDKLSDMVRLDKEISLIKIDVEGAEYLVLDGARELIKKWKPIVIFEHGLGASEHYGYGPDVVHDYFTELDMKVSNLKAFINNGTSLTRAAFEKQYQDKINHYFIAHK